MSKAFKVGLILGLLFCLGVYSFLLLQTNQTRENYLFCGFILLLFLIVYCVSVLDFRITGTSIGIEQTVKQIESSKEEIKKVAGVLIKIAMILADGAGRYDGIPDVHLKEINKCKDSLKDFLNPNLEHHVNETICDLNKQLEVRNQRKQ
jgi:hypothetical protein